MDIDGLISSVFVKNALWDQTDQQHHNRYVLDELWDAVAEEMKSTRNVVRTKWKTLRDTFCKELKKIPVKRSGDGASQPTKSSWQYFDTLYFLKDQFTARFTGGNLPNIECENILDEDELDSQLTEENVQNRDSVINNNQPPESETFSEFESTLASASATNTSNVTQTPIPPQTSKTFERKKQSDSDIGTTLVRLEESKMKLLKNQHQQTVDEDKSFLDSRLPHLRRLSPQQKMRLRMKMQKLVYKFVCQSEPDSLLACRMRHRNIQIPWPLLLTSVLFLKRIINKFPENEQYDIPKIFFLPQGNCKTFRRIDGVKITVCPVLY